MFLLGFYCWVSRSKLGVKMSVKMLVASKLVTSFKIIFYLHDLILRTTSPLWYCPLDVFARHFDAAAFAMNAILGVNH